MNLKPGDLVMVVKPTACCGSAKSLGKILTVEAYVESDLSFCANCNRHVTTASALVHIGDSWVVDEHRLIKIDPLAEQEKTEATEAA